MYAVFRLQITECVITVHLNRDRFDSHLITFHKVGNRGLVAVTLAPAHIHTHEHGGPVVCLSTASTGIYSEDRTEIVTLLTEHILQFQSFHGLFCL